MNVTIRESTKSDADVDAIVALSIALHQLHEACDPRCSRTLDGAGNMYREEALAWLDETDTRIMLAEDGSGEVVGMAIGRVERRPDRDPPVSAHIRRVFVKESARGRGVARMLLKPLCTFFASQDVAGVSLHYLIANELASRFWAGLGFEPFLMNAKTTVAGLIEKL